MALLNTEPAGMFGEFDIIQHDMQEGAGDNDGREQTDQHTQS